MIVNTVKYKVVPGSIDEVARLSAKIRAYALTLKGNIDYCPMSSPYEADTMVSVERWEDQESLDAYMASENCRKFQEARNQYLVSGSMSSQVYDAELRKEYIY